MKAEIAEYRPIKAVLFDLFETLVTEAYSDRPTEQSFVDKLGLRLEDVRSWRVAHLRDRMTGTYATYREELLELCGSLGATIDAAIIEHVSRDRLQRKRKYLLGVDSEIIELLSRLGAHGWTIGVVSNASPDEVASWSECPLRNSVDDAVFSCHVGCMKPDPDIYNLACARLGLSSTETIFVGDGGSDELQGAAAVGMKAVQAQWYYSRDIALDAIPDLAAIGRIDDLFHHLENVAS